MTQTSLSAATLAHWEHRYPAPGHPSGASLSLRVGHERAGASHCCRPRRDAAFLIHGSAIKSRANLHCFNHMPISNRRLKGGLRIILCAVSGKIRRASSLIASQLPPTSKSLIATFDISENERSPCKCSSYQNSNRNKIGLLHLTSSPARTSITSPCKRAPANLHPEKVISYRAGGRRMLLLPHGTHEKG
jgi:hypothetical protein